MSIELKALIFDMDGVIVDSEPLWRRAMIKGFNSVGIDFTEEDCRKTQGTRFKEVVELWLNVHKVTSIRAPELEHHILRILLQLIDEEGQAIHGVLEVLREGIDKGLRIGLATSSSHELMYAVLEKLQMRLYFDALVSAEHMAFGKPHPEVFLQCAEQLRVSPSSCLVLEDSLNGVIAAKAAQMRVIAIPDTEHAHLKQFALADYKVTTMAEALRIVKTLC